MNQVTHDLFHAARNAKISDCRYPGLGPELIIKEWGKLIQSDYDERLKISCLKVRGECDKAEASILSILTEMATDIKEIKQDHNKLRLENARLLSTVNVLNNQVAVLKEGWIESHQHLDKKIGGLSKVFTSTADGSPSPLRKRSRISEGEGDGNNGSDRSSEMIYVDSMKGTILNDDSCPTMDTSFLEAMHYVPPPVHPNPPSLHDKTIPTCLMGWNFDAEEKSKKRSDKDKTLINLLLQLREERRINPTNISKSNLESMCESPNISLYILVWKWLNLLGHMIVLVFLLVVMTKISQPY